MKGLGTDEGKLINVIADLGPGDARSLIEAYSQEIHRDLISDIREETSGHFEAALVALLTPAIEYDARLVKKAMQGLGTDEQALTDVICTRHPVELKALCEEYKRLFDTDLISDIDADTTEDFKKPLLHRLRKALAPEEKEDIERDVEAVYKAGPGRIGTDEPAFIELLSHGSRDHLHKLNKAFFIAHAQSLKEAIESQTALPAGVRRALLAIVVPPAEYFSDRLFHAMKGVGTDDSTLIRTIVSQRFRVLHEIAALFANKYDKLLKVAVADETSGDYKRLAIALIEKALEGKFVLVQ